MKKRLILLFVCWLSLMISACDSSGTAQGIASRCQSARNQGSCTITIKSLEGGPVFEKIGTSTSWASSRQAQVTARVKIGRGSVRVTVRDSSGKETSAEGKTGQTIELKGVAEVLPGKARGFSIYFTSIEGEAEDIRADVTYRGQ